MIDADGNLFPEPCHYCTAGRLSFFRDGTSSPVCNICWPSVRDSLGRWGDLRGVGREVMESEKRMQRGRWPINSAKL